MLALSLVRVERANPMAWRPNRYLPPANVCTRYEAHCNHPGVNMNMLSPVPALAQMHPPPIISVAGKRAHVLLSDDMMLTIHGQTRR
jgi:hypothetical protein